jgi:phosphoribosylanthranilate isomerase
MYIKICGITRLDQAQAIAQMGADALGFICVPSSPRYISPLQIGKITTTLTTLEIKVGQKTTALGLIGVFLNASPEEICQTTIQGGLNGVQLHGDESPEFCCELRSLLDKINPQIQLIKALRVRNAEGLAQARIYDDVVDTILLDAYDPQMAGGTGKTIDWQMLRDFRPNCPWWLAGGLSPENVQQAIVLVSPDGLDVSSGVERSAGDKDLSKVSQFVAIAKS